VTSPLVHIGLHRTGTTWLQQGLFTEAAGVFHPVLSMERTIDLIVRLHDLAWDPAPARKAIEKGLAAAAQAGRLPVLSCEELSGNPHAGAWNAATLADRLHAVLPEARVLIVVRRQEELVLSNHRQYLARGGVGSLKRYLHPDPRWFRVPRFRFETFEFDRLVACHRERFGADRVEVRCHEAIGEPVEFAREIVRLAGGDPARLEIATLPRDRVNSSPSALLSAILRRTNRLCRRDDVNPHAPWHLWRLHQALQVHQALQALDRVVLRRLSSGLDRRERRLVAEACRGRYAESNARLAAMTGLDLAGSGYELPANSRVGTETAAGPRR
jgi:hypothetical protein